MTDYNKIKRFCEEQSAISSEVLDNFLVYYAAAKDKLQEDFIAKFKRFKHIESDMPEGWVNTITMQYIAHRILKAGGSIKKYLNHVAMKELDPEEYAFLQNLSVTPWRFCFSKIISRPAPDFYQMEDVFTGESFLLYSKSTGEILEEGPVMLWFNLIGFNGQCWQTYGPVCNFQSFDADDIFFYASELESSIVSDEMLCKYVDENPIPFMILWSGGNYPVIVTRGHEVVQVFGENNLKQIDILKLKKSFTVEYADGVFRITHGKLSEPPHSAEAYYEEASETISATALTDAGYEKIVSRLLKSGIELPDQPDIRVHIPMLTFIREKLKRDINLTPHAHLFQIKPKPKEAEQIKNLNTALKLLLPYINSGDIPNLDEIAQQSGLSRDTLIDFLKQVTDTKKKMSKKKR